MNPDEAATPPKFRHEFAAVALLALFIVISWLAYLPGLQGTLHFDDLHNLSGLVDVNDTQSAFRFVFSGDAGPLGRPIALATFALQAYAWPDSLELLIRTNIAIHLINGLLVAWLLYVLCLSSQLRHPKRFPYVAVVGASIWMLMPILASSSLFIVQRMTTLSATFVLLGFIGYLYSRRLLETRPFTGLAICSLTIIGATLFAAFTKENGALLPILIFCAEATILKRPRVPRLEAAWKAWRLGALATPAIILVLYLLIRANYDELALLTREFSAHERLLTQFHILWSYLYSAFIPTTWSIGPFHDDTTIYRNWLAPLSLAAVGGWIIVTVFAIAARHKAPLLTFSVFWYLSAHALESTTIPLEMYFEHRNYVPLIGPVFALTASALLLSQHHLRCVTAGLATYILVLSITLFSFTSLWGNPTLAAEIWAMRKPDSTRATQYLAQSLQLQGDPFTARRMLRLHAEEFPRNASVLLQSLAISCQVQPHEDHLEDKATLALNLPKARFSHGVAGAVEQLLEFASTETCESVTFQFIEETLATLMSNEAYMSHPISAHNLHLLMARVGIEKRNLNQTMTHIEAALEAEFSLATLQLAVSILDDAGLSDFANDYILKGRDSAPRHPIRSRIWHAGLDELERNRIVIQSRRPSNEDNA